MLHSHHRSCLSQDPLRQSGEHQWQSVIPRHVSVTARMAIPVQNEGKDDSHPYPYQSKRLREKKPHSRSHPAAALANTSLSLFYFPVSNLAFSTLHQFLKSLRTWQLPRLTARTSTAKQSQQYQRPIATSPQPTTIAIMAPTVHCVRHAQGYHNLTTANHHMHDPLLTPFGEQQCSDLQANFPNPSSIDLIVASPIKRTIYTALLSFSDIIEEKQLKIIALPELQETSDLPCDTGSEVEELRKEFEGKPVDFELVKEGWNGKRGKWAPTSKAIEKRAREARLWLQGRSEKNIVVVTHGGMASPCPAVI